MTLLYTFTGIVYLASKITHEVGIIIVILQNKETKDIKQLAQIYVTGK